MTNTEILAREVLNMRSLQVEYEKLCRAKRFGIYKKVKAEELAKTYSQMRDAEQKVREMCMDILGIEEEEQ